jgi:ATP-binding cassette subfamily B protein RaxB
VIDALQRVNFRFRRDLPTVFQSEAAECGLACLAMIAGYHGHAEDLFDLRRRFGVSLQGARLTDLTRIAEQLAMAPRALRLELDEIGQLALPCVLHWDLNHFVVLKEVVRGGVVIHDPASGVRRLTMKQLSDHFTGVALELRPTSSFQRRKVSTPLRITDTIGRITGLKRSLAQLLSLALVIELLLVIAPFFMQWVVDNVLVSGDRDLLVTLALGFAFVMLLQVAFTSIRTWMLLVLSTSLKVQGRTSVLTHLLRLPSSYFETRYLGDIVSRVGSLDTIQHALTTDVVEALLDGFFALLTLGIMFVFSPMLAAIVLSVAVIYGLMRWALYTPLREASMEAIVWSARRDNHFLETLRAIKTIKLMGAQNIRRAHWLNLFVEAINRDLVTQKLRLVFRIVDGLLDGLLHIAIILLGASLVLDNTFSVGMLLAFVSYKDQFVQRVTALINKAVDLRMLRLHAERLADVALAEPEPQSHSRVEGAVEFRASIELRDLRYRYSEHDPWVLDGVSLKIEPGESVAIVGASGCGKTTLMKILASLLQPSSGEVLVGGEPIAHVGLEAYRRAIGVVMQDDHLLAGSIADNICFFATRPDRERIERCARLAAVHDDIRQMAMGYDSLIGDMGTSLSGGQKQRVLLARALYRQPRILLLDEATSHLDVKLERAVNDAIRRTRITRIIIAHRPETIRSAHRVITLEGGRVVGDLRVATDGGQAATR